MGYQVHRDGSGRPLLLLHSGFGTWVEFRGLAAELAGDFDLLAPTLPGSVGGPPLDVRRSMLAEHADHAERILDEAGWTEPVDVLGSSYGGVLALELLRRGRAGRVVALAPPWVAGAGVAFYGALFAGLPLLGLTRAAWPRTTRSGTLNGLWFHQSRIAPRIDPADVAVLLESWSRFPLYRVGYHAGRGGPGMPETSEVDASRATLVWGGRDRLVPGWMRGRWSRALPSARVVELPGFPHQPHLRDPRAVADVVRAALAH